MILSWNSTFYTYKAILSLLLSQNRPGYFATFRADPPREPQNKIISSFNSSAKTHLRDAFSVVSSVLTSINPSSAIASRVAGSSRVVQTRFHSWRSSPWGQNRQEMKVQQFCLRAGPHVGGSITQKGCTFEFFAQNSYKFRSLGGR